MKIINDRYRIVDTIYKENNMVEYLVEDLKKNKMVKRLKIFDTEMSNYDFVKSFEMHFIEVATLYHENILSAYEFQTILTINGSKVNRNQFFYTYEHYDSTKIVHYDELNKSEVNQVLVQLCKAVRYLHYRGFIYKYLNFDAMILLRDHGKITLKIREFANNYVDDYFFKLGYERSNHFLAPEVLWGEVPDVTADIYALGNIFYYLYYKVDYKLKSIQNIMKSPQLTEIHKFIIRATSHIKDERHRSIDEFIAALSALILIDIDNNDEQYYDRLYDLTRIIGRDGVIRDINKVIEDKQKKNTSVNAIFVRGDVGSGKTRVLQEIQFNCKIHKVNHIFIRKHHDHSPYAIVRQIVAYLSKMDDISPLLIQKYGIELGAVVPELKQKWNLKDDESELSVLRVLNRIYNFFLEYTVNHFFVLIIDDEDALAGSERYFFDLLIHQKNQANYCIIASDYNTEKEMGYGDEFIKIIKLSSLNLEETGYLVMSTLGMNQIPYKLTHRLMLETQGVPSMTKRMIKKLWQDEVIYFDPILLRWELDRVDDSFKFQYEVSQSTEIERVMQGLTASQLKLLQQLSILKDSFNMSVILEFTGISEEEAYYFIYYMEEAKIITKKISDVEYVFAINGNDLKKAFYDMLSLEEIKALSHKAAEIYELRFINANDFNEALIDYLMDSDNFEKAARYCVIFSDYYFEKSNAHKALDLLELALNIYERLKDQAQIGKTTKRLVKQYIKVGRLERAVESIRSIEANRLMENPKDMIDIGLERATIAYYKNEVQRGIEIVDEMIEKSKTIGYVHGEFEGVRIKARCLRNSGDLDAHLLLVDEYLDKSYATNQVHFEAVFENEKGVNFLYHNQFDSSIDSFNRSLERYQSLQDEENVISLLNNFGVIYLDGFGDYYLARDYFRKAYNRASNRNYFVAIPTYLNNIGETYRIEGRYVTAIKYFEEAYQMAENVGDRNIIVLALLNMCHAYLLNENYSKTHTIINRLEHEINIIKRRDYDKFDYFMLHFEYYLEMNAVIKVDKWRYEFDADEVLDDFRKYRLKIIDLRLEHKKNHIIFNQKRVPFEEIKNLKDETHNPSEAKLLRDFINDMMFDLLDDHDFVALDRLILIDDELKAQYNTKAIRMRRDVIDASLSDNAIERITNLIGFFKEHSQEMLWRIYKVLGDEYFFEEDLYHALQYYLMALDVLAELAQDILHEYRETYILYDDVKMALKTRINKIVEAFIQQQESVESSNLYEERIESVDDFFDLNLYRMLYDNEVFTREMLANNVLAQENRFSSPTDLIQNLGKDELNNLKTILKFFEQTTFSELAEMYLFDEHDNISEVIASKPREEHFDIMKLLNAIGSDSEGIYVNKIDNRTNVQLLTGDQKGLICFPIHESEIKLTTPENRKEDLLLVKKRVVGYVFIETKNVINHINQSTFKLCKSFISLIYLMINNYHLKRVSTIDKLTGVFLRKHIEQEFTKELNLARMQNAPLSVIMLDIDKFKGVNDNYGHRKGDEILSSIGSLIKSSIRKSDYVGRYGGEEFVIVLPETDAVDGFNVAEKIRVLVESKKLLGEEMPLTVSLGVSTFPIDGSNEEELIEKADQSLYYSKNNGRNRATSWDEKLNKEGHRYDKLTGILTGNISSDTRNVKALLDIVKQLEEQDDKNSKILNTFMTLVDITEADEISFVKFNDDGEITESLFKKKGQNEYSEKLELSPRLIEKYRHSESSISFVDWDEIVSYDEATNIPNWKSYIILAFDEPMTKGLLAISVNIKDKEFDFGNLNFVESLKPVLRHILF
ncbi:MAG: hypothetical protein PWP51_1206 [Clostridiales bacterium]|nr:hypothetical protein [Clostridiales bacterium]